MLKSFILENGGVRTPYINKTFVRRVLQLNSNVFKYHDLFFVKRHYYYLSLDTDKFSQFNAIARSSTIFNYIEDTFVRVYNGRLWRTFEVTEWHLGFKFGEFSRTRKRAFFRIKTLRKKKKKKPSLDKELYIKKIKLLKSGKFRKNRVLTKSGEIAI